MANELILAKPTDQEVPDYVLAAGDADLGDLDVYISPARLKIVQGTARAPFDEYDKGTAVILPVMQVLARPGESFLFTPVFMFPEWLLVNPLSTQGELPMIRERTFDKSSELAERAKDPARRYQSCPEKPSQDMKNQMCYVEALNFMCVIHGIPIMQGVPIVMSFQKGEHFSGRKLATLIKMRNAKMYAGIYVASTGAPRRNADGAWYGVDCTNPTSEVSPTWVDVTSFALFGEMHDGLKAEKDRIMVNYADTDLGESAGEDDADTDLGESAGEDDASSEF